MILTSSHVVPPPILHTRGLWNRCGRDAVLSLLVMGGLLGAMRLLGMMAP